jgi:hypothetical protein
VTFLSHLTRILNYLSSAITDKYHRGQQEHGGQLWRKAGMLAHAEAEMLDLCVYIPTLRDQLTEVQTMLQHGAMEEARDALARILGPAEE